MGELFSNVTTENFRLLAAKLYDKPNAVWEEFEEDLDRIQYIKRLLTKYHSSKVLKERLILNHLVVFYNVFGPEGTRLLFFKLDKKDWEVLKPFLVMLGYLPEVVKGINGKDINTADIKLDKRAIEALRNLK